MKRSERVVAFRGSSLSVFLVLFAFLAISSAQDVVAPSQISPEASKQIRALMDEKASRTPAQRKISSHLLYGMKVRAGKTVAAGVKTPRSAVLADARGNVLVDIRARVSKSLIKAIEQAGGRVVYSSLSSQSIRARVPMSKLESIAARSDVRKVNPAIGAYTQRVLPEGSAGYRFTPNLLAGMDPKRTAGVKPGFDQRAQNVAKQLQQKLRQHAAKSQPDAASPVDTTGDIAHRADEARDFFGINGAGVKIGVLSDSVDFLDQVQAAGNLPDVTVLPGQSGLDEGNSGEGTAILEIVHALAPGAQLFFATAFTSDSSFADNIRALRAAGCDIIVDDVIYFNESPFQDGPIAQAVIDVTNDGALYFSSAGNEGNFNDGTSGVWEGDFKSGGALPLIPGGDVNDFGGGRIANFILAGGFVVGLYWSDPAGASSNDYDLYILSYNLDAIDDASTDFQDGTQDPFEIVGSPFGGERIVIVRNDGAEVRALHVNTFRGILGTRTDGQTHGHGSVAKAFSVAAVDVATAHGGAFQGGPTEPVEAFTSDGPRRVFFNPDGSPIKPGKLLFSNGGGQTRRKPDITGADGVSVTTPGFDPFFGTSAAAPHAAAIAALLRAAKPNLTQARIRKALTATALDLQAPGFDRDSGFGTVTAFAALQNVGAQPQPFLSLGTVTATPDNGNFIGPGGSASLSVQLVNSGGASANSLHGVVSTSTAGVTVTQGSSDYPSLGAGGGTGVNITPFTFSLSSDAACGVRIDFTITVTFTGDASPKEFTFSVPTGKAKDIAKTVKYKGVPVAIPDDDPNGVDIPISVTGIKGNLANLKFLIGGQVCSADEGSTTVGIDHTFVGDLILKLTSPAGTSVSFVNRPGAGTFGSGGNNFCKTLLDDTATDSIEDIDSDGAPYTGTFKPSSPLAAFVGEDPNGTWTLNVSDNAAGDTGSVRAFSLINTGFTCK